MVVIANVLLETPACYDKKFGVLGDIMRCLEPNAADGCARDEDLGGRREGIISNQCGRIMKIDYAPVFPVISALSSLAASFETV